jgi:hypothetical protein
MDHALTAAVTGRVFLRTTTCNPGFFRGVEEAKRRQGSESDITRIWVVEARRQSSPVDASQPKQVALN